jgi:hypothetical protein
MLQFWKICDILNSFKTVSSMPYAICRWVLRALQKKEFWLCFVLSPSNQNSAALSRHILLYILISNFKQNPSAYSDFGKNWQKQYKIYSSLISIIWFCWCPIRQYYGKKKAIDYLKSNLKLLTKCELRAENEGTVAELHIQFRLFYTNVWW